MKIKILTCFSLLLLSFISIADDQSPKTAQDILDNVRKDLTSLSAEFVQFEIDANENISEKIGGQVWLDTPNKFKWEYAEPAPQLIVANGKEVWIFDEDLDQVTIKKQESTKNPIYVLLNKQETEENFELTLLAEISMHDKGDKESHYNWIEMTPKNPGDDVKKVWLGVENNKLKVIKLKNQFDNIVVFEFNNILRNPKLETGFFTFVVPKGVDVIREAGFSAEF